MATTTATRNNVCKKARGYEDGNVFVTFTFAGGNTETVRPEEFNPEVNRYLWCSGVEHTLGDAYAAAKGNVALAIEMFAARRAALADGAIEGKRGGGGFNPIPYLDEAFRRLGGANEDWWLAVRESLNDDVKRQIATTAEIAPVIQKIRAERRPAPTLDLEAIKKTLLPSS